MVDRTKFKKNTRDDIHGKNSRKYCWLTGLTEDRTKGRQDKR